MSNKLVPDNRWAIKDPQPQTQAAVPVVIPKTRSSIVVEERKQMVEVQRQTKMIQVGGEYFCFDAAQMMRMIKNTTQTIGEYKRMDNGMSRYVVPALRKSRSDMVSDLENHFGVHWECDDKGKSRFYA